MEELRQENVILELELVAGSRESRLEALWELLSHLARFPQEEP